MFSKPLLLKRNLTCVQNHGILLVFKFAQDFAGSSFLESSKPLYDLQVCRSLLKKKTIKTMTSVYFVDEKKWRAPSTVKRIIVYYSSWLLHGKKGYLWKEKQKLCTILLVSLTRSINCQISFIHVWMCTSMIACVS